MLLKIRLTKVRNFFDPSKRFFIISRIPLSLENCQILSHVKSLILTISLYTLYEEGDR